MTELEVLTELLSEIASDGELQLANNVLLISIDTSLKLILAGITMILIFGVVQRWKH